MGLSQFRESLGWMIKRIHLKNTQAAMNNVILIVLIISLSGIGHSVWYFDHKRCELHLYQIQHLIKLNDVIEHNVPNRSRNRDQSLRTLGM